MGVPMEMVTVASFEDRLEALMARGALEAEGLHAVVLGEHHGPIRLDVPADEADLARSILHADRSRDIDLMDSEGGSTDAIPTCSACGSASIQQASASLLSTIVFAMMGGRPRRRWTCLTCGARWRGAAHRDH